MPIIISTVLESQCPICKRTFKEWYCPSCGLPISIKERKRPENKYAENFQLCAKCDTPNPFGAKFCKNCGLDIFLQAKDRNGHGWVDLGLSVLWSTEAINGYYFWMDTANIATQSFCSQVGLNYRQDDDLRKRILAGKDTAAYEWGYKWRMPAYEDFQELIEKCTWELDVISHRLHINNGFETKRIKAFKITGPNGKHIYLPALGYSSGHYSPVWNCNLMEWHPEINLLGVNFKYWSSTKESNDTHAKVYIFSPRILGIPADEDDLRKDKILERHRLLLSSSTPIDERMKEFMKTEYVSKSNHDNAYVVRPVADKKWQGKL